MLLKSVGKPIVYANYHSVLFRVSPCDSYSKFCKVACRLDQRLVQKIRMCKVAWIVDAKWHAEWTQSGMQSGRKVAWTVDAKWHAEWTQSGMESRRKIACIIDSGLVQKKIRICKIACKVE